MLRLFIISFRKGWPIHFFATMDEMADRVVDADLLGVNDFAFLESDCWTINEIELKFETVETFLLKHFQSRLVFNPCLRSNSAD